LNPFAPPEAPVADHPTPKPGSALKAILLGLAVDIGGTLIASLAIGIVFSLSLASSGASEGDITARLANFGKQGWEYAVGVVIGCGFSILGGFVCARISRRTDYRLGVILALLSLALGLLLTVGTETEPSDFVEAAASVACVLIGYRFGKPRPAR
jgi:hypothetical protein